MLLETAKSYSVLLLRGPKGRCPASSASVWNGLDQRGPLPARNGCEGMHYHSVCGTRVLFAVFGRRHGLLPGTLVLETATDCCRLTGRAVGRPPLSPLVNRTYVDNYFGSSSSSICISSVMLLATYTHSYIASFVAAISPQHLHFNPGLVVSDALVQKCLCLFQRHALFGACCLAGCRVCFRLEHCCHRPAFVLSWCCLYVSLPSCTRHLYSVHI
jgi:hypothetical protein